MKFVDRVHARAFPKRFVAHSLATHLQGPWAIQPRPLALAVDEARARIAATPASEIRELALQPETDRLALRVRMEPRTEAAPMVAPAAPGMAGDGPAETYCACIPVCGVIVRGDASCARVMGVDATGLAEIEHALQTAAADPSVTEICLEVSSPGGVGTGIQEIVDLIQAIKASKPVRAEISGLCASAAYWLVSQCTEIVAEPSAFVGSIGAFAVVEDSSRAAEAAGCTVHVLRSGPHKGVGAPGAPILPEQLAELQRQVDAIAGLFVESIAAGRGMTVEAVRALATGQEWLAGEARTLGLIDRLTTAELGAEGHPSPATDPAGLEASGHAREGGLTSPVKAGAVQEDIVNEKDLAALTARLDQIEASNKQKDAELVELRKKNTELETAERARAAALAETVKARKAAVIDVGVQAGRIVGDMRAQVEAYSAAVGDDVGKLEQFVGSLPVQTHARPLGSTVEQPQGGALSAQERHLAVAFGVSEEQMQRAGEVEFISLDGRTGLTAEKKRIVLAKG